MTEASKRTTGQSHLAMVNDKFWESMVTSAFQKFSLRNVLIQIFLFIKNEVNQCVLHID